MRSMAQVNPKGFAPLQFVTAMGALLVFVLASVPAKADCPANAAALSNRAAGAGFEGRDHEAIGLFRESVSAWQGCRAGFTPGSSLWIDATMREVDDGVALALTLHESGEVDAAFSRGSDAEQLMVVLCTFTSRMNQ